MVYVAIGTAALGVLMAVFMPNWKLPYVLSRGFLTLDSDAILTLICPGGLRRVYTTCEPWELNNFNSP